MRLRRLRGMVCERFTGTPDGRFLDKDPVFRKDFRAKQRAMVSLRIREWRGLTPMIVERSTTKTRSQELSLSIYQSKTLLR